MPESQDRVKQLFNDALDKAPEERGTFLDSACEGLPKLRAEVDVLLSAYGSAGDFLAGVAVEDDAAPDRSSDRGTITDQRPLSEKAGQHIGRYKLLQQIGEGGFGVVFMAEQQEPVVRRVALKVIKLGMDTKQVIGRFEIERQALAMMDHPNIAKVLDAGATATGRPYFVMELVRGDPITEYCDRNQLPLKKRLKLFQQVCMAVRRAHQKGIIHRDIKPSNVLVTVADGRPIPKVIDFGIAKATSARLTDKTVFTEFRQLIGTPAYMSPEQAEMSGVDVDTRSDVYSLGVLLYELLTSTTPFDKKKLEGVAYAEIQRIIREEEPPRPSTRISTVGTETKVAKARQLGDAVQLARGLRGDLDWIAMKAMEKDRTRRYATASALAADIGRYLAHEPVTAGPPSTTYRLRVLMRRNRGLVIGTAAVFLTLVLGIIGTSLGLVEALDAREEARLSAEEAIEEADNARQAQAAEAEARQEAEDARQLAEKNAQLAEASAERARLEVAKFKAINKYLQVDMLSSVDPEVARGREITVREVLTQTARDLEEGALRESPAVEAEVRFTVGTMYSKLARYEEAERNLRVALSLREGLMETGTASELVAVKRELAVVLGVLADNEEATAQFESAIELLRAEPELDSDALVELLVPYADFLVNNGDLGGSERQTRLALSHLSDQASGTAVARVTLLELLARPPMLRGDFREAAARLREAVDAARKELGTDHPQYTMILNYLAMALAEMGKREQAEEYFDESLSIAERVFGKSHPTTLKIARNRAWLQEMQRGVHSDAELTLRDAYEQARKRSHGDSRELVEAMTQLANTLVLNGRIYEAEKLFREALEMATRLHGENHPSAIGATHNLGIACRLTGRDQEAEDCFLRSLEIARLYFGEGALLIPTALTNLGVLYLENGRTREAEQALRDAESSLRGTSGDAHPMLARNLEGQAILLAYRGEHARSMEFTREALRMAEAVPGPDHVETAMMRTRLAFRLYDTGQTDQMGELIAAAAEVFEDPDYRHHYFREEYLLNAAFYHLDDGNLSKAEEFARECVTVSKTNRPQAHMVVASTLVNLAYVLAACRRYEETEEVCREALDLFERHNPSYWRIGEVKTILGESLAGRERFKEAEPLLLEGMEEIGKTQGNSLVRWFCTRRVAEAYELWDTFEPERGYDEKAEEWQAELKRVRSMMR